MSHVCFALVMRRVMRHAMWQLLAWSERCWAVSTEDFVCLLYLLSPILPPTRSYPPCVYPRYESHSNGDSCCGALLEPSRIAATSLPGAPGPPGQNEVGPITSHSVARAATCCRVCVSATE